MTIVADASAVLACFQREPGWQSAQQALQTDAVMGAANYSEVLQKIRQRDADASLAELVLESWGVRIEPVTAADGVRAARLWHRGGPSLADRLCLALAERLDADVLTADREWDRSEWGKSGRVRQLRHPTGG